MLTILGIIGGLILLGAGCSIAAVLFSNGRRRNTSAIDLRTACTQQIIEAEVHGETIGFEKGYTAGKDDGVREIKATMASGLRELADALEGKEDNDTDVYRGEEENEVDDYEPGNQS